MIGLEVIHSRSCGFILLLLVSTSQIFNEKSIDKGKTLNTSCLDPTSTSPFASRGRGGGRNL